MKRILNSLLLAVIIHVSCYSQQTFEDQIKINQSENKYPSLRITTRQGLFNGGHPHLYFLNTGGDFTTPASTPAGRLLGTIIYSGYDGASNVQIGRIAVATTGEFSPGNYPARMDFKIGGTGTCCGITRMSIDGVTGNVGIGTTNTGSHKLAVEGSIGSRQVVVQTGNWSDFVFEKEYQLPSLAEVENHIQEHGHLSEIPSEEEVIKNGIDLGEMDAKLLQKIEELTLYTIQQEKEIRRLQSVEKRLDDLEKLLKSKK
ncbi:hypothetical protein [Aquimarina sp. RZ0]|uniref:hypothetical protein n=1 Tax=Aquimarina sp. RZ0 TaxID=2607730 RepID=UPI0011F24CBF|nr:hypothetical protein [Aquimarina sp. RZ0]KAA1244076.1 hypothetical protein F0000_18300 [Aquimarina sp. RZ0]